MIGCCSPSRGGVTGSERGDLRLGGLDPVEQPGGVAHEHATGPGLCGTRCPSHFTQNVSIGWNASAGGSRPQVSLQFTAENVSNNVYLISKESTMVQGQYSIPRMLSGSIKIGF